MSKILVLGSGGQIGTELLVSLRQLFGDSNVVASDIKPASAQDLALGPYEELNVLDKNKLYEIIAKHKVEQVYLLAALLS
jgi:dTDP-4-dehydrorhamnose reductase